MNRILELCLRLTRRLLILILFFTTAEIFAQSSEKVIPHVIAFQGVITQKSGEKISDGTYNVTFTLFDDKENGNSVWSESHSNLKIENGLLNILLGKQSSSNPITIKFDKKYYLDITVNGDVNISNRIELGGVAYSLGSSFAEEVKDSAITTEKFVDNAVTDEKIQSVSFSKLGDVDPDPYSVYWTIQGNIIYGPEQYGDGEYVDYVGTIFKQDFVFKTFSIERMRFDPYGRVTIGTEKDTVEFTVIGKSKFIDVFIKGNLGICVRPGGSKVHVNSNDIYPFKVDVNHVNRFLINQNGRVEINSSISANKKDKEESYPLFIHSQNQGIAIKVDGNANNDNNYVSFWDDDGMTGRIEGETIVNYIADPCNIVTAAYNATMAGADAYALANAAGSEPASAIAFTAETGYNAILLELDLLQLGVTYESAAGDYAEWLEKIDPDEQIYSGEIVGVYNGKISKNTLDADQLLCISHAPVVLGNQPPEGKESLFEKTAFLGQVPVKVLGKVNRGDYIIPSGLNDGVGLAISPDMMTIDEYIKVIGRAWDYSGTEGVKFVNTAIGFDNREMIKLLQLESEKQRRLNTLYQTANEKIKNADSKISEMYLRIEKCNSQLQNEKAKAGSKISIKEVLGNNQTVNEKK